MKHFLAKRKAHLLFGSALLFTIALNCVLAFTPGQTFMVTIWNGFGAIRPMEYLMFAGFWYACASQRPRDDWYSPLTSLNLSQSNPRK